MTGHSVTLAIAVPAAVMSAAGFGLASAAQQRATREVPVAGTLNPRLFLHLLRRPWWLVGSAAAVAALVLQLVALAFGPLAVVQPLLAVGVAFAGTSAALLRRRAPDRYVLLGAVVTAGGLAAFLLVARPVAPAVSQDVHLGASPALLVALVAVLVGSLAFAAFSDRPSRSLALALATGTLFGVTAALMKVVAAVLGQGLGALVSTPELYAACVVGPLGVLLSQNTFQQGRLLSPAVAVITTVDPVVGVLAGVAWLGESIDASTGHLVGAVLAGLAVLVGIATVTLRGQLLLARGDAAEDAGPATTVSRPDVPPRPRSARRSR